MMRYNAIDATAVVKTRNDAHADPSVGRTRPRQQRRASGPSRIEGKSAVDETTTASGRVYRNTIWSADYLGVSRHTLACWRSRGEGPPFVKVGGSVRYRVADLDAWAEGRRRDPSARR
jgi:predicted DNA-binding transcriptional regulator AlpA